jgi:hypothetical protein
MILEECYIRRDCLVIEDLGLQKSVYDIWSETENGTAIRNMALTLPAHGVAALLPH